VEQKTFEPVFEQVTMATGLPKNEISAELHHILSAAGLNSENLTLDQLRMALADYVQDVLVAAKEELAEAQRVLQNSHQAD
jgi:hypothetical protein